MDAIEAIKTRRSIRKYSSREISKDIIKDIVDCARLAPSANNIQPWEFVVITSKIKLRDIAEITDYGKFIENAAACIIVVCKEAKYYLEDGSAATENILVAAKSYGIGSCWVAGDKKPYAREILSLLNFPIGYKLISIIALGYPIEAPKPIKRNLDEVLHLEEFRR